MVLPAALPPTAPVHLPGALRFDLGPDEGTEPGATEADASARRAAARPWRIFVAEPAEPPPPEGWPALFMLDANAGFATFTETARRAAVRPAATGVGPTLLVGIGYPTQAPHDRARRRFDFSAGPPREAAEAGLAPEGLEGLPGTGGSAAFLGFIRSRLLPVLAGRWPLDPARRTLFGHSLGGAFVLEVFTRAPELFASHVAVSPSLWWDEPALLAGLAARERGARARLALMVGEYEEGLAPWQEGAPGATAIAARRARRGMVAATRRYAEAARAALGPEAVLACAVLAGEDHASVLPAAMSRALRFAAGGPL
ncbi:alpha/beta hydrolase [Ancylobacter lacus]|uniref:alpha/beta hydrolase n=1 Tax=Ancylobacter lacus TaxID=2579970 RepID=UPI001BCE25C6|nr:alpha/beta hydrolase-fold protein [Ancylobacter lacus]MBS7539007.1 alpha/beta hydrolase [Ancylobacter lacus]